MPHAQHAVASTYSTYDSTDAVAAFSCVCLQLLLELHVSRRFAAGFSPVPQLTTFVSHLLDTHGFEIARRTLNPWSLVLNHTFSDELPLRLRERALDVCLSDWANWEVALLRPKK